MGRQKKAHVTGIPFCGCLRRIYNGTLSQTLPKGLRPLGIPLLHPVSPFGS